MKSFIKWVVAFIALVAASTLATCGAIKFLGDKILPQTFDSAVVTAQLDEPNRFDALESLTDVYQLRQNMMDESRIDSTFLAIPDGVLSNVASVLLKRAGSTTKDEIVNEYIAGQTVYNNLPPGPIVQTNATTTSVDPMISMSLEKVENTAVTEAPSTSVGDKESPPSKDTVINGKRYKPVN